PLLITVDRMLEIGEEYDRRHPDKFERMIDETDIDDIALFFYTSGTTGLPKASMVSHRSVIGMGNALRHGVVFDDTDESLSYLPIAWITEQILNVVCSLLFGFTVNFPETQETVQENIREIGPTILMLGPRAWESHIKTIRVKILNAKWINRLFFNLSIKAGKIVGDAAIQGKRAVLGWRIIQGLADIFVFRPLRDRLGMSRTRWAITGGTAISPDVFNYFHSIGVPLTQMYGSSEIGAVSIHRRGEVKPETCGPPLEGYELNISDEGEVQVRCPYLFQGYYKAPDKINEVVKDGWYQTGDFGRIDETGHLIVMDRMADLKAISGDKSFSPQYAETRLRFSPFIKDAIVAGNRDIDHAVSIIIIDYDNVGQWAEANHVAYTTYSDLSQKKESIELVRKEIETINNYLPEWAKIRKFINLHKEFDPDEAELTRTRKVRRDFLEDKYGEMIEALVSGKTNLTVTVSVTYRDGTTSELESSVSINKVNE
ncbi:MAG: AMP-binding protein, partial [Thermodesulfobacteriota bacterium]|nr:AMP-binding protein [Thermodesulfobacteriota bacterium]